MFQARVRPGFGGIAAALCALAVPTTAAACSADLGRWPNLDMPNAIFSVECRRILNDDVPWVPPFDNPPSRGYGVRRKLHEVSSDQDSADLADALSNVEDADAIVARYAALRAQFATHLAPYFQNEDEADWYPPKGGTAVPAPFDLAPYDETLAKVPAEFAEYLRGAVAYHHRDWDTAIGRFEAVLALPPRQREYRSTWAAFMLGKSWLRKDPAQAIRYFEQTRALADEGFIDSLGLAAASKGWEGHALLLAGDYRNAIHRYLDQEQFDRIDLDKACRAALKSGANLSALVDDTVVQRLLTAWIVAHPLDKERSARWLTAIERAQQDGVIEDADRVAWCAYQRGDFDTAKRWLELADPGSHYMRWILAKLLLRDGKLDEAEAILASLTTDVPFDFPWRVQTYGSDWKLVDPEFVRELAGDDLGFARDRQGRYGDALAAYLTSDNDAMAVELAEQILTIDELQRFVDERMASVKPTRTDRENFYFSNPGPRDILARRYARAGMWDKAAAWNNEYAVKVRDLLDIAHDDSKRASERAEAFMDAGQTIREHGQEFFNPILVPYEHMMAPNVSQHPREQRIVKSMKDYPRMNYFKAVAADYLWQAAALLPDNDVQCARALYTGGTYLKNKHPQEADRFYKALVRRNPNLLIAQQADDLRWFPKAFTDVVVYRPLPKHWYGRKRDLAVGAAIAVAALALGSLAFRKTGRAASM